MTYKEELIRLLVEADALRFGEFTLKSGRKSPYFLNAGMLRTGRHFELLGEMYADCVMQTIGGNFDVLFGPAYKGITLANSAACALYRKYGLEKEICFNRKEAKDHGEGGSLVGAPLYDGARLIIIEDVTTSGASVREVMPLIRAAADVRVSDMYTMLDRMEAGVDGKYAIDEIKREFSVTVHPMVTVREVIDFLRNREIGGRVVLDDEKRARMEKYMERYCVKR